MDAEVSFNITDDQRNNVSSIFCCDFHHKEIITGDCRIIKVIH